MRSLNRTTENVFKKERKKDIIEREGSHDLKKTEDDTSYVTFP